MKTKKMDFSDHGGEQKNRKRINTGEGKAQSRIEGEKNEVRWGGNHKEEGKEESLAFLFPVGVNGRGISTRKKEEKRNRSRVGILIIYGLCFASIETASLGPFDLVEIYWTVYL